jgi:N-acetylneuraminic acid mutarotase
VSPTAWTDASGDLWLFGGSGYGATGIAYGFLNDLWKYIPTANQWAWMGGSNAVWETGGAAAGQAGVYGALGVPADANTPGVRYGASSWTDSNGNFWLFGGTGLDSWGLYGGLNDLWEYNPSIRQWAWMGGEYWVNQSGRYGTLGVADFGNMPGARSAASSWIDHNGDFWLLGGTGYDSSGTVGDLNDLWKYSPSSGQWTWMGGSGMTGARGVYRNKGTADPANIPGARESAATWTDASGNLWLFGGEGYDSTGTAGALNDLWEFQFSTPPPTFSPAGGTYASVQTVTISDVMAGVTIYYTTDSSTPTTSSAVYSGPIKVRTTETLKAVAIASGYSLSDAASATYTINLPAATPTFSLTAGTYTSAQTVTISDATAGATIYYTTDGSTPTTSSTVYSGPVKVTSAETLKAVAIASGYSLSDVASATYTINLPAATPTFSVTPGTYTSAQTVTISDATIGATIYYTANGSTPTTGSTQYSGPIKVNATETLKAVAVASGYSLSDVASATYTINLPAATPTFSPAAGTYTSAQTITISDGTAGATIYYTTDGSTPTTGSTIYSSPIKVSMTETLKAVAIASGYSLSGVASATYTINFPAATPVFSPAAGTYTSVQIVTVSDATSGATIYYTTDGSTPTTSSTQYTSPIKVSTTETLKAVAIASGYSLSDVASATYTLNLPVDFTIAASPDSTTIYTGEAAKYAIAITPINGFDLPVSLACSQLPANMTCAFSPSIVPAGSNSAVLIVQTSAPAKSAASLKYGPLGASALAGVLLLVIPRRQRRSHKLWMRMLVVIALCTFGHAISGCGAPQSLTGGTPVGKQSIVVTATAVNGSQTLIRTSTVAVNVKSLF